MNRPTMKGPVPAKMRISRALAQMGFESRRGSEQAVLLGRVTVNGEIVQDVATNVTPGRDELAVDGKPLTWVTKQEYYAVNKPPGVVSTVKDAHADQTVVELVPTSARLFPVGRLDKESEGLVLLTNDGDLANRVTHPRYEVEKEYAALVRPTPTNAIIERLRQGIELDGRAAMPTSVMLRIHDGEAWVRIIITEGRQHEVRRLLGAVGLEVRRLIRTRIGPVQLGTLKSGAYRKLEAREIRALSQGPSESGRAPSRRGRSPRAHPTALPASVRRRDTAAPTLRARTGRRTPGSARADTPPRPRRESGA